MSDSTKFTILPTPEKSLIDKKLYRVIKLQNGLTAMLISDLASLQEGEEACSQIDDESDVLLSGDEEQDSCSEDNNSDYGCNDVVSDEEDSNNAQEEYMPAVAIRIGAGSFEDPKKTGGLMHFLEHMVFMGSSKYPKESFFEAFVQKHGGSDNGFTKLECTTYFFEIQEEYLKKGCDIFAQFFISPLIRKEAISREKKAVHSEFQLALPIDDYRLDHFMSSLANDDHPLSTFMWGNDETLDLNVSDEELQTLLFALWKRYYSSEHMKLVVQARESLDTLQDWVIEIFSKVRNNNLPRPTYESLAFPWNMNVWHKFYGIVPIKELTAVVISWALPSFSSKYRSKPLGYITNLIADEGAGSILSYLKKKMFAFHLSAGSDDDDETDHNSIFCKFTITIHLSSEGFHKLGDVILTVFQYLNLLRSVPPVDRIFEECQMIDGMAFNYESEESPVVNVEHLVSNMMRYPPQHYLKGSELVFDYDPQGIKDVLQLLTFDKCNIVAQSKYYAREHLATQTEKWFGIQYFRKDIPTEWKDMIDQYPLNPELDFPPPNQYVASNFAILEPLQGAPEHPVKIKSNDFGELWYKQDNKFKLPKGICCVQWINEEWCNSAEMAAMIQLYIKLYCYIYNESLYPTTEALFNHSMSQDDMGVIIKLGGFSEHFVKCLQLIRTLMSRLFDDLDEVTFNHVKKELLKSYHNGLISPCAMRTDIRLNILLDTHWQIAERLLAVRDLDIHSFQKKIGNFLDCYYTKVLVQGNFTSSEAEEMFDIMASKDPDSKNKHFEIKTRKLKTGSWAARVTSPNQADANSSIVNYYQDGPGNLSQEVVNQLLMYLMSEPAFDFLRTKETLGYFVSSTNRCTFGILGFSVTVDYHANKHDVDLVDRKIEDFLIHFKKYLKKMASSEFNEFSMSFRKEKITIDLSLREEVVRNWEEILSGEYMFDRCQKHYELIPKITKENVLSKLSELTTRNNDNYNKLSIQIQGSEVPQKNECLDYQDTLKLPYNDLVKCVAPDDCDNSLTKYVEDLQSFKRSLDHHPVTKIV